MISISTQTFFLEKQSDPAMARFAFAYTITITNKGIDAVQLMSRHWFITDGNNKIQEVEGEGVVGETPTILPGRSFRYTSGAVIQTPVGTMHGSYSFIDGDGNSFDVPIPVFRLAQKESIH